MKPKSAEQLTGNPNATDVEIRGARLEICNSCDMKEQGMCSVCWCSIGRITADMTHFCPMLKW